LLLLFPGKRDGGEHMTGRQWLAAIITITGGILLDHPASRTDQSITAMFAEESPRSINLLAVKTAAHLILLFHARRRL
jgi:ribosome biogenesis SPOUT family RNA methylase Rps3